MEFSIQALTQLRTILRGFRKARGLTQSELAKKLAITQQSYAQLEANPATASIERLFKVLAILEVDLVFKDRKDSLQKNESNLLNSVKALNKATDKLSFNKLFSKQLKIECNPVFQKLAESMKTVQDKTVFTDATSQDTKNILAKDDLLTAISIMGDKESLKKMLDEELRIAFEEYDDET